MKLLKLKMMKLPFYTVGCAGFLLLSLTGCLDDDSDNLPEPVPVAYLSIYHGAPDAAALDIVVDDETINSNPFEYTKHTSGYVAFYTGEREIKFTEYNASNTLADTTVNLKENKIYSMFVASDTSDSGGIETLLLEDNLLEPAAGKAVIRLVNLSPDVPAVDLMMEDGEAPVFENLAYQTASTFHEIPAGAVSFDLTATGESDVLATVSDADLQEGRVYTFIVRGFNTPPAGNDNQLGVQIIPNFFSY